MANVPMEAGDVETGYADVVATLTRELTRARAENSALKRHIEGEDGRFWARHAEVITEVEEQAAADAGAATDPEPPAPE